MRSLHLRILHAVAPIAKQKMVHCGLGVCPTAENRFRCCVHGFIIIIGQRQSRVHSPSSCDIVCGALCRWAFGNFGVVLVVQYGRSRLYDVVCLLKRFPIQMNACVLKSTTNSRDTHTHISHATEPLRTHKHTQKISRNIHSNMCSSHTPFGQSPVIVNARRLVTIKRGVSPR